MVNAEDGGERQFNVFGHGQMADRVLMLWDGEDGSGVLSIEYISISFCFLLTGRCGGRGSERDIIKVYAF